MFVKQFIFTFLNDHHHGSSKVIYIPVIDLIDMILLEHHRIVDLSCIVDLLEFIWAFYIKGLIYDFVKSRRWLYNNITPFLLG